MGTTTVSSEVSDMQHGHFIQPLVNDDSQETLALRLRQKGLLTQDAAQTARSWYRLGSIASGTKLMPLSFTLQGRTHTLCGVT